MAYNLERINGKLKTSKITSVAEYSANQSLGVDLISSRNITFIKGTLKVNYTTATSAPTAIEDGIAKLVLNPAIQYNGGAQTPMGALSLQQLNLYGQHLFNGRLKNDQPPTAAGETGTAEVEFIISPSLNPFDPRVPLYCIPGEAPSINNIKFAGQWGNEASVWTDGTNATINSATLSIDEEAGWSFGPNITDLQNLISDPSKPGYAYLPLWLTSSQPFDAAYSGLGLGVRFPTDVVVRRIFIMVKDNSGNRSDDVVSELAIETASVEDLFGPVNFKPAQATMAARLDMDAIRGCFLIDCTKDTRDTGFANVSEGVVVTKADKLYVKFSTTAPGSIDFLFDCVRQIKVF